MSQEEVVLEKLDLEEIKRMSQILAETILQNTELFEDEGLQEITVVTCVSGYQVIREDQIVEVVNLDLIASSTAGVFDPLGQLQDWLASTFDAVASWIVSGIETFIDTYVLPAISGVTTSIQTFINDYVLTSIDNLNVSLQSFIDASLDALSAGISSLINDYVLPAISDVSTAISGIVTTISDFMNETLLPAIINSVSSALTAIPDLINTYVLPAINAIPETLTSFISEQVIPLFTTLSTSISNLINTYVIPAISEVATTITGFISEQVIPSILGAVNAIPDFINTYVLPAISELATTITSFISEQVIPSILGAINAIPSFINETVLPAIGGVATTISTFFTETVIPSISQAISTIPDLINTYVIPAITNLASSISESISGLASSIVSLINETLIPAISGVIDSITQLSAGITNYFNTQVLPAISNLSTTVQISFTNIMTAIDEVRTAVTSWLPDLGSLFKPIIDFFSGVSEGFTAFITNPIEWLQTSVVAPMMNALNSFWNAIVGFWNWFMGVFQGFGEWLWNGAVTIAQAFLNTAVSGAKTVYEGMVKIGEFLKDAFLSPVMAVFDAIGKEMAGYIYEMIERIQKGEGRGEVLEFMGLFTMLVSTQFTFRMINRALLWLGEQTGDIDIFPVISIGILKNGVEQRIKLPLRLGYVFKHLGAEFSKYADELMRGFFYGMAIWWTQPMVRFLNALWRNSIPVELPPVNILVEATRRSLPHEKFDAILNQSVRFMSLYGYSDFVIDLYFKEAEQYYVEIKDRFDKTRKVPLSLMYQLPSSSDVARMMVRDIIINIEDFEKFFKATGMYPDIARLYYLLHFRYPSPEVLWNFTMRGISGLLWAKISKDEEEAIKRDVEASGGFYPVPPVAFNKMDQPTCATLLDAFKTYMKWHDYARFSYINGFTSDNLIYVDTLADIPTKIDQRWMVKWGLYEHLVRKGVSYKSPIQEFVTKVIERERASDIWMDLTNFSRTLQATGMHPYWIPITATAEAMNALTEERTLLRTGFQNLFKEGFITSETLTSVLSGAFITSFKIAYFDIEDTTWKEGWINLPIMFLPAEQRLITLRAYADRAMDILREIQRDVSNAYQDSIIATKEEYETKFTQVIESINEVMPEQIKLEFDKNYYDKYIDALGIYKEVYTVRRIRSWAMRWLGWIMYRVATGLVTDEELARLVDTLAKYSKLTDIEKEFFDAVLEVMRGIAKRDYAPTPTQIATLSEYLVVPDELIEKCFEVKMISEEWQPIWRQYIKVRPVADDIKSLLATYRRALIYTTLPEELEKEILSYAQKINFGSEELKILQLRVQLEELIIQSKEYLPTPTMLATLSEYLTLPTELIRQTLEKRRVPTEWMNIWLTYVRTRPIKADAKALLSAYVRAFRYGVVTKDQVDAFVKTLQNYGFSSQEIAFISEAVNLEEQILEAKEYIPTPYTLATLCEYIPEARQFFDDVVRARRIPREWIPVWARYVDIRPIINEVRKMISRAEDLYTYFMIDEETYKKVLEELKDLGYTDKEIELMLTSTRYERYYRAWRELIGDVDRMTTLADYSPEARSFALGQLYKMIDALPIDEETKAVLKKMWEQFIRIKPVKSEVTSYIRDLVNLYVEGLISDQAFSEELEALREWGLDDYEIQFWKAIAGARRARKLKIVVG